MDDRLNFVDIRFCSDGLALKLAKLGSPFIVLYQLMSDVSEGQAGQQPRFGCVTMDSIVLSAPANIG